MVFGEHIANYSKFPRKLKNPQCNEEEQERVKQFYQDEDNKKLTYYSALTEAEGYCKKTRLEEIMDFANKCSYKRLGLAFCIGLAKEANVLCKILMHNGFEVHSVVCKNGSIPKEFLGVKENEKVRPGTYEPMCNPIGQAIFLRMNVNLTQAAVAEYLGFEEKTGRGRV